MFPSFVIVQGAPSRLTGWLCSRQSFRVQGSFCRVALPLLQTLSMLHPHHPWHITISGPAGLIITYTSLPRSLFWQLEFPVCGSEASLKCLGAYPLQGEPRSVTAETWWINTPTPSSMGGMALKYVFHAALQNSSAGLTPRCPWW